jgi:hypothetical protein
MRKVFTVLVLAVISFGCEPQIIYFNVQPSSAAAGPANVTLNWKISVGDGDISADQPVTPSLNPPKKVSSQGSMPVQLCKTTTFKLALPYGGEKTAKVTVAQACGAACGVQHLTFTGTCPSANQGPVYGVQTVSAAIGPGNIKDLLSDADFPIHVMRGNVTIALGAGGGPISLPIPAVAAAGDYTISVPGQAGLTICANAPTPVGGGSADAPVVHLTVTPECPP